MKLVGRGLACGKIILIGEHAVVYNKPAIAFPFNGLETRVEIFETNDEITIDSIHCNDYLNECSNTLYGIKELVKYLFKTFNMNPFGVHIKITSF